MTNDVTNKKMVVGFLFSGERVLLVQKTHPDWQAGLLNGVGGVIEKDETPHAAMVREFGEETKFKGEIDWRHFVTEIEPFGAYVYFFVAYLLIDSMKGYSWPLVNDADESLAWVHHHDLPHMRCVGNLNWLVPLALDWRGPRTVTVEVAGDIREQATW